MTDLTVRANCPEHGDLQTAGSDFLLITDEADVLNGYKFKCPEGGHHIVYRKASERVRSLLINAGIVVVEYNSDISRDVEEHQSIDYRLGGLQTDEIIDLYKNIENIENNTEQLYSEVK